MSAEFRPETVRSAAEEQGVSADRLGATLRRVRNHAADGVEAYLRSAWDVDRDEVLLGNVEETYVVALGRRRWVDLADHLVMDDPMLDAVKAAHRDRARSLLDGLGPDDVPDRTAPFVVDYPDNWARARDAVRQHWEHFFRHGLSPAEVVDYWMVETSSFAPDEWARVRDVQAEAVRKNVRQAREKLLRDMAL